MGLSSKQTEIQTSQLLIEIAQGIATLISDPKALEKQAKAAYALPDAEQAKADEARKQIAVYRDLINQNDAQKQEIADGLADLEKKKTSFQAQVTSLEAQKADLAQKEALFSETKRNILALAEETKALNAKLSERESKLMAWDQKLGERQAKIEAEEKDLAERIEQMRLLAGGK